MKKIKFKAINLNIFILLNYFDILAEQIILKDREEFVEGELRRFYRSGGAMLD